MADTLKIIDKLLEGIEIRLNTNFLLETQHFCGKQQIIYCLLEPLTAITIISMVLWNIEPCDSIRWIIRSRITRGNALINYTGDDAAYTKVIEHKHFAQDNEKVQALPHTVITYEIPRSVGAG